MSKIIHKHTQLMLGGTGLTSTLYKSCGTTNHNKIHLWFDNGSVEISAVLDKTLGIDRHGDVEHNNNKKVYAQEEVLYYINLVLGLTVEGFLYTSEVGL